jgi:two-component system chemotaxis response regulator CheB
MTGRAARGRPVVGIAASAGGPAAFAVLLPAIGGLAAPVLLVQHLHPHFADGFVTWMARVSALPVELARDGVRLRPGTVYVGPPGTHLRLGPGQVAVLDASPPALHRPSANELFHSIAVQAGADGVGVILTGMGLDGAAGLLALREAGGTTVAQDQSSAVDGMPAEARRLNAADRSLPLGRIASAILEAVRARVR